MNDVWCYSTSLAYQNNDQFQLDDRKGLIYCIFSCNNCKKNIYLYLKLSDLKRVMVKLIEKGTYKNKLQFKTVKLYGLKLNISYNYICIAA